MSYQVVVMYVVGAALTLAGVWMLLRLRDAALSERKTYAYRMVGIMLTSGGVVLLMSATAMWSWSMPL